MQNKYVGDLGDFGKFGLLRALCSPVEPAGASPISLALLNPPTQPGLSGPVSRRQRIEDHDTHRLKSALYEEVNRALSLEPRLYGALGIIFVILGVMIATIGALFASPLLTKLLHPGPVLVALVLTSLTVSLISLVLVGCITWPRRRR